MFRGSEPGRSCPSAPTERAVPAIASVFVGSDGTSLVPTSSQGLGSGSVVIVVVLSALLLYRYVLEQSGRERNQVQAMLLSLIPPLLVTFAVIVLFALLTNL